MSDSASAVSQIPFAPVAPNGSVKTSNGSAKSPHRGSIQSVDRALSLLEALAEAGGEASLTDLSRRTQLNVSTCHHLLSTLVNWGYVAKVPGRRSYALGARVLYLGHACLRQVDLPRKAQAYIDRINQVTGETVHLAVLQADTIVTLVKREARHAVRVDTGMVGRSDAPHATATGKAMIAWLPEEQIRRMVSPTDMKRFTDKTIVDFATLIEELRHVRRNGHAMDREEFQPGVICVGSAIRDHSGAVVGAISASAPAMRATEQHLDLMRQEVIAAANALSAELGEPGAMKPAVANA
ncbi:IclR family transcriptional regulator [Pseudorhodoplanes sp.]|uniref:IclR family transcriptional regulator n=1 Tax=Pseudorhodoplanes sp. TaxID=1934341 RepID=UPI002C5793A2|nr:IclR family transcriptional regulator [Pseudorhodoplanes sp.]HWV53402.1 IclR family transcriptional regulator [Pseudorhodoplanes sp.]